MINKIIAEDYNESAWSIDKRHNKPELIDRFTELLEGYVALQKEVNLLRERDEKLSHNLKIFSRPVEVVGDVEGV